MQKPDKSLLLMFVDEFAKVDYGQRSVDDVSGNFYGIPVILIRSNDKGADNIVTHELIHGLGKPITKNTSAGYLTGDIDNMGRYGQFESQEPRWPRL